MRRYFIRIIAFHCGFVLILSLVEVGLFSASDYNIFGITSQE